MISAYLLLHYHCFLKFMRQVSSIRTFCVLQRCCVSVFMRRPAIEATVRAAHRFVISIDFGWIDVNERSILSVKITCSLRLFLLYEMQVRFLESLEA